MTSALASNTAQKPPARFRALKRWTLMLSIPFLGTLLMLVCLQRSLIYHPTRATLPAEDAGFRPGQAHDIVLHTEDQCQLGGWLVLASGHSATSGDDLKHELSAGRPFILYFSGNAGHRGYRHEEVEVLVQAGVDVLISDYRGYGDSSGDPSEEGLAQDARAIWRYATEVQKIAASRIVLFGESLGGGVAVRLANELEAKRISPRGLIVRSAFNSLTDTAAFHFPWIPARWLLFDRYPSDMRIKNVTCPILQLHGSRDSVVPISLGRKLFAAARDKSESGIAKRFIELPLADHNDVLETSGREVSKEITEFLRTTSQSKSEN